MGRATRRTRHVAKASAAHVPDQTEGQRAGDTFATCISGVESARYGPISYDPVSKESSPLPNQEGFVVTRDELQIAIENALGSPGST